MNQSEDKPKKLSFFHIILSTLAAFFGVQSDSNRQRDFDQGHFGHFIFAGLLLGTLFILTVVGVVMLVMNLAGV